MKRGQAFGPHMKKSYTYRELPIGAVSIGIHDDVLKTGTWRALRPVMTMKTPPCSEACPAGVDIRGFISLMKHGRLEEACRAYLKENPFPGICGRVCNHLCEAACNRTHFDQAVGIHALERFLADMEVPFEPAGASMGKRIAVVGSGPAGMSCACYLAELGYQITIFEAMEVVGGLLRFGIPRYRLPVEAVEKEALRLRGLGVDFRTGCPIHAENWGHLETFDAIVLAHGASRPANPPFDISTIPGRRVISGLDLLKSVKLGEEVSLGKKVLIVGGGNTAVDAARVSIRLGAYPTLIYRRTRSEMPAFETEIEAALEEGVEILFLTSPTEIEEHGAGLRIRCIKNELGDMDSSGRRTPIPIKGSEFYLKADTVVTAVGEAADVSFLPEGIAVSPHQTIRVDEWGSTGRAGIFACGDVIDQPRSVAHAIGSGKAAAIAIDCYFKGTPTSGLRSALKIGEKGALSFRRYVEGMAHEGPRATVRFQDLNTHYFLHKDRFERPEIPGPGRKDFAEICGNLGEDDALGEAQRCFHCGTCCGCANCWLLCPDGSVAMREAGCEIDYEYCKGCGICANECPAGAIEMEKEG